MNEILKAITTRRSIRTFKAEPLKEHELQAIIEAGQYAPSARNEQAWHFSVVQNPAILAKINAILQEIFANSGNPALAERAKAENFSPFYHAPTLIIVSGDQNAIAPEPDVSLALGNCFLAAQALGIGSVWIHSLRQLFNTPAGKALQQTLGIPEGYVIYGSGAFGYNAGDLPTAEPRRAGTVTFVR